MTKRASRVLLGWVAAPFLVLGCYALSVLTESCANAVLTEVQSPDGKYRVVVFERTCSNTMAWVTHASVLPRSAELPNRAGNALVSFDRHGSLLEGKGLAPEVQARWAGPSELVLSYDAATFARHAAESVGAVRVRHQTTD